MMFRGMANMPGPSSFRLRRHSGILTRGNSHSGVSSRNGYNSKMPANRLKF
jgi:hypothetical protein